MRSRVTFVLLASIVGAAHAQAPDCNAPKTMQDVAACVEIELRDADARLNTLYSSIMARANQASRQALRSQQRDWLRDRDSECEVKAVAADREHWYAALAEKPHTAACVSNETSYRIAQLQSMLDGTAMPSRREFKQQQSIAMQMVGTTPDVQGRPRVPTRHSSGKWYFEVTVDLERSAKAGLHNIMAGFRSVNDQVMHLTSHELRTSDRGEMTIGCALDLDNGMLYYREGGSWNGREPGSNRGLEMKLGQDYLAQVMGSESITELMAAGLIRPNFGDTPFIYALPDGYHGWR